MSRYTNDMTEHADEKLLRLLASSDAALEGYLSLRNSLGHGRLDVRLRMLIAILVAEANGCTYALSAHVAAARRADITEDAIADARQGRSADARVHAALRFVDALVHAHGAVNDVELEKLRRAGFDDGAIVELVTNVGLHILAAYAALCAALPPDETPVVPYAYGN